MRRALVGLALALALPASHAVQPLGRLFYTPAQRAQLDAARSRKERPVAAVEAEQPQPLPETITYDGVVRRSDGKTTVWINNRPIYDGKAPDGVPLTSRVRPDGSVTLGIAQSDRSVNLRVGQSMEIVSGTIAEPYGRARTSDKPAGKPEAAAAKPASAQAAGVARPAAAAPRSSDDDDAQPR